MGEHGGHAAGEAVLTEDEGLSLAVAAILALALLARLMGGR